MGLEIERKFLVRGDAWREDASATEYRQGFLSLAPERTVRVRIGGEKAWLTIKGLAEGLARTEFEYEIPVSDAEQLLGLCLPGVISKTRFRIEHAGHLWEIDVFHGENAGLIVAEVELSKAEESVELPEWVGEEVSHDPRYANSRLAQEPWTTWTDNE